MQPGGRGLTRRIDLHRDEAHFIAGFELPDLPEICLDDRDRTNETAQARTIRSENHGHVAGEIDRPDCVWIIVNIRWMQPGFAAVLARPFRLRPDQAHAGAARIEMDFPFGCEELLYIPRAEVFRRAVGAVDNTQRAHGSQLRHEGQDGACADIAQGIEMEHVACAKRTAAVSAELAERKRAAAAE